MGLAIANPIEKLEYFQYFLDYKNHKPDIPIDINPYHSYSIPTTGEAIQTMQYTIFDKADKLLTAVR